MNLTTADSLSSSSSSSSTSTSTQAQADCPFDLVTIDLDGTLVDSVKDLHEAVIRMQHALARPTSTETDVRSWVGNGIEKLVHRALTGDMEAVAEPDTFIPGLAAFMQAYAEVNGQYSTLYPGVMQGLTWLATLGIPIVMVTNKASQFARPLLQHQGIDHFFVQRIGGDDVPSKKPDPDALLLAAKLCAVAPERSVHIGDSISDFKAARAAGFKVIGVTYGYNHGHSVSALEAPLAPDAIMDSFVELPEVFQQFRPV
jgi:phosphoglycolate phosphatase